MIKLDFAFRFQRRELYKIGECIYIKFVKMLHCWKSHVAAHKIYTFCIEAISVYSRKGDWGIPQIFASHPLHPPHTHVKVGWDNYF